MNKNIINRRRLLLSRRSNQYPWNLSKLKRSLKNRKWFRIKFSSDLLKDRKIFFKKKKMKTYETKIKMLFRRIYAPGVNANQFKKLFKFKNRYRLTFRRIISLEHRFDTLVFRLYMLKNITLAQFCISNNFFLLNGESKLSYKSILKPGYIIEINHSKVWNILYIHMLTTIASMKKYYSRLFFKFSYPFISKKKYKIFKEDRWPKERSIRFLKNSISHKKKIYYNSKQKIKFKKYFYFKIVIRRRIFAFRKNDFFYKSIKKKKK